MTDQHALFATWEPIVDLASSEVVGGELLCAHPHPADPARWRAWYAQIGLCARDAGLTGFCTVNIDTRQILDKPLVRALLGAFQEAAHIPWHVEWTERGGRHQVEAAAAAFCALRDRAPIGLVIDDVGAGQDGLHRIALTAPDFIKIDRHIVVRARQYRTARSIIRHVADLGASIGAQTIVEGIESPADRDLVCDCGVLLGQGYLWPARSLTRAA
jgi:EAL domain-containing protein (putative c-di-GMP-specific phosphodiesterase class I)